MPKSETTTTAAVGRDVEIGSGLRTLLLAIVGALLCVTPVASAAGAVAGVAAAQLSSPEPAGVGPAYPYTVDVTVSTSAVEVGPAQVDGNVPISISAYNPTSNACYWGHSGIADTVGTSYCASGCDRDVPMGGNYRKIWIICASSSGLDVHYMIPQEQ